MHNRIDELFDAEYEPEVDLNGDFESPADSPDVESAKRALLQPDSPGAQLIREAERIVRKYPVEVFLAAALGASILFRLPGARRRMLQSARLLMRLAANR